MRTPAALLLALLVAACAGAPAPRAVDPIAGLAFLEGEWRADGDEGRCTEERWQRSGSDTLEGSARTIASGAVVETEAMRIEARASAVTFVASPSGQERTEFTMIERTGERALFENLAHDFPQRIVYARAGDELVARIEDASGERSASWTFRPGRCE